VITSSDTSLAGSGPIGYPLFGEDRKTIFETNELSKFFGGVRAVNDINLRIREGEIVGLIGPNGAGKTTVFNLITGFLEPSKGLVVFEGENLVGRKPHEIAQRGIARTFQIAKSFPRFTVLENMQAASHLFCKFGFCQGILRTPGYRTKETSGLEHALKTLDVVGLAEWKNVIAATLPHAHQKLLGIAMALATGPKLLLLDEPLEGMSAEEVDRALDVMRAIRSYGVTILLIEHNMRAVMNVCEKITVISFGQEIARGPPDEVKQDPEVIKAYLGACEYGG
jgi:branched-chain amino acid transport system ATP-binding protein